MPSEHHSASTHDETFWAGLKQGKLLLQRCRSSGRHQWYPRGHSMFAEHAETEWIESAGSGVVETYTIVHRTHDPVYSLPYMLAVIRLEEGVQVTARIDSEHPHLVSISAPVQFTGVPHDGASVLPTFHLLEESPDDLS